MSDTLAPPPPASAPSPPSTDPGTAPSPAPQLGLWGDAPGSFADVYQTPGASFPSSIGETLRPWALSQQVLRSAGTAIAEHGMFDEYGRPLPGSEPQPNVPAAQLEAKYGIPGRLKFADQPDMPETVAQGMYDAKIDEIRRQDAIAARPSGLISGGARYGADFLAGFLDPLQLAATMIPVGAPARLAEFFGEGLAGRMATRAMEGAIGGAAGNLPLVGARYALSQQDQADYSAVDAMSDIAMGAGMGATLHNLFGLGRDLLAGRFAATPAGRMVEADPATRLAALGTSLSAVVEDRPADVAPLFDAMGAYVSRSNTEEVLRSRTIEMQREADAMRAEADAIPHVTEQVDEPGSMIRPPQPDAETQARLDAVMEELTDPAHSPTAARRVELTDEYRMLSQGEAAGSELEQARSASQRQGLLIAAARIEAQIEELRNATPRIVPAEASPVTEPPRLGATAEAPPPAAALAPGAAQIRMAVQSEPPAPGDVAARFDAAARRAAGEPPDPAFTAAQHEAEAAARAPANAAAAEMALQTADHETFLRSADAAGQLDAQSARELEAANDLEPQGRLLAQAFMAAAACLMRGGMG